ncbi:hypothetical protein KSP40_PGU008727 [Platanthera guangdongensis]|uniref:Uncharacterized protein n=1 Tax=Platanthera guangdongensis TaxID=2320717 RepID=A0ABR2MNT4_9ASPA
MGQPDLRTGAVCPQVAGAFSGRDESEFAGCCADSMELASVRHGSNLAVWMLDRGVSFVARTMCLEVARSDEAVRMDSCRLDVQKGTISGSGGAVKFGNRGFCGLGRDGWPPEKFFADAMPYTQSLLSERRAMAYHAKAAPPTVTMPRLKAMVSGSIGGYLDVAFNFHTQAFLEDNLLDQFQLIGRNIVMFGDDTWIKLFPGLFKRYDGVNSFYVKDTIEVDFNVSRHLEVELVAKDWKLMDTLEPALEEPLKRHEKRGLWLTANYQWKPDADRRAKSGILHYLGLDHAGHIGGRHSSLMASKLKEMDDTIRLIHTQNPLKGDEYGRRTLLQPPVTSSDFARSTPMNSADTELARLFISSNSIELQHPCENTRHVFPWDLPARCTVVVSDHGMTERGNHGGSSYEETDSLALFVDLRAESPTYEPSMDTEVFQAKQLTGRRVSG